VTKINRTSQTSTLEQRILGLLRTRSHSIHVGELRSLLLLDKEEHAELSEQLSRMAEAGLVTELPGGKYRAPRHPPRNAAPRFNEQRTRSAASRGRGKPDTRIGRLSIHARGFGFVTTDESGPDIFLPPNALGNALNGDKVCVRVFPSPKGFDGSVIEVLERALHYIGGQLHILPGVTFIEPDDDRLKARVQVVGELPKGTHTGQGVIAKVVGYPETPGEPLLATVIESFDAAEFADFEIRRILLSNNVQEEFPEDAQAEAKAYAGHVTQAEIEGRVDFRELELLTIDPDDARDHDDAVWAERLPDRGYRIVVAIADVSHYVRPGTALDREALARGCTIYLPPRAIPMLPRELSSLLASLLPEVDRLALAVDLEIDATGEVRSHRFVECVMRSAARLSYGGVARALGFTSEPAAQPAADARVPLLTTLLEVAKLLGAQRKRRGSLDFDLPEAKVKLNPETGEPIDVERSRKDPGVRVAYNMIEELMLLANEVVARDLSERKVAAIYRVHGAPNEEKVLAFAELSRSLGFQLDEDVAERPGKLAPFLASVAGTPHAEVLSYLVLRAMQQATYATENIGHFGLAADDYVHFTSPIRRYPDLAVHRIVRKIARGESTRSKKLKDDLAEQATESSRLERRAMLIEREVVDLYRAMLMRDRIGDEFQATITGITEHGIFAAIESPCVDVFLPMNSLPSDRYETDRYGTRLYGLNSGVSYALFDRLTVRIDDVSVARRRISAVPVTAESDSATARAGQQRAPGAARPGTRPRAQIGAIRPGTRPRPLLERSGKSQPKRDSDQRRGGRPEPAKGTKSGRDTQRSSKSAQGGQARATKPGRKRKQRKR
jgi:ribonuclease R